MSTPLILVLAAATVGFTWPLAMRAGDILPGADYRFDQFILAYALEWIHGSVASGSMNVFDANMCYPARNVLVGSDHLLGFAPVYALLRALGASPLASLHLLVVATSFASALGMAALILHASAGDRAAAVAAGVLFAFTPYQMAVLGMWLHVTAVFCLPLIVLAVDRMLEGDRRAPVLLGAVALVQVGLGVYGTVYAILVGTAYLSARLLAGRSRLRPTSIALAAAMLLPAAFLAVGIASKYAAATQDYLRVDLATAIRNNIAGRLEYLDPLDGPAGLARRLARLLGAAPRANDRPDAGRVTLLLALIGAVACVLRRDPASRARVAGLVAVAISGIGLALGPGFLWLGNLAIPLPILWLDQVPLFGNLRGAERFMSVAAVGIATLGGLGVHALLHGRPRTVRLAATLLVVVLARLDAGALPFGDLPAGSNGAVEILAREGDGSPVLELPLLGVGDRLGAAVLQAATHRQPTTLCLTGHYPAAWRTLALRLGIPPDARTLAQVLNAGGYRWLLIHKGLGFDATLDAAAAIGQRRYEDTFVALFERGGGWQAIGAPDEGAAALLPTMRLALASRTVAAGKAVAVRAEVVLPDWAGDAPTLALTLQWRDEAGKPVVRQDDPPHAARRQALPPRWQGALEPLRALPPTMFAVPRHREGGPRSALLWAVAPNVPGRYVLHARLHSSWFAIVAPYEEPPALAEATITLEAMSGQPSPPAPRRRGSFLPPAGRPASSDTRTTGTEARREAGASARPRPGVPRQEILGQPVVPAMAPAMPHAADLILCAVGPPP